MLKKTGGNIVPAPREIGMWWGQAALALPACRWTLSGRRAGDDRQGAKGPRAENRGAPCPRLAELTGWNPPDANPPGARASRKAREPGG